MNSLEVSDAESKAVQKTPNRVSLESMVEKIMRLDYLNPECLPSMTICVMQMKNGFVVIGKSAPADPENFNEELGRKFAYEDCVRQLWPLEGYALREKLSAGA
ncbi:Gp49 family protein [Phyllobacteriaceae bacterium JZ32]